MPHTVEKSGTYQSDDKVRSTQLNAGDVISDEDAVAYGLLTQKQAEKAADEAEPVPAVVDEGPKEGRNKGAAPENRAK